MYFNWCPGSTSDIVLKKVEAAGSWHTVLLKALEKGFCFVRPMRPRHHKQTIMRFTTKRSRIVVTLFFMCLPYAVFAAGDETTTRQIDWTPVMEAIIQVESEGNTHAVSGNSVGAMQITPILVAECNNILKRRKSKKRFTLKDRFNLAKSKEMFLLIQSFHNVENNIEKAIRSWNGGMHYSIRATQGYYNKVMARIASHRQQ